MSESDRGEMSSWGFAVFSLHVGNWPFENLVKTMTYIMVTMDYVQEGKEGSWHRNSVKRDHDLNNECVPAFSLDIHTAQGQIKLEVLNGVASLTLFHLFSFLQVSPHTLSYFADSSSASHINFLSRTLYCSEQLPWLKQFKRYPGSPCFLTLIHCVDRVCGLLLIP